MRKTLFKNHKRVAFFGGVKAYLENLHRDMEKELLAKRNGSDLILLSYKDLHNRCLDKKLKQELIELKIIS